MITVTEIAFTGYPVTDLAKSRHFYETILGLKTGMVFEEEGKGWIEYEIGSSTLAISNMAPDWKPSPAGPTAGLEVGDFDAAIAWLKENQVNFLMEPMPTPVCRMACIADPDGNSITIHQRNAA